MTPASGNSLLNGCGWLLAFLSSRGIHVVASSIIRWTNDDVGVSGWWQVFAPVMYVMMLYSSHIGYVRTWY